MSEHKQKKNNNNNQQFTEKKTNHLNVMICFFFFSLSLRWRILCCCYWLKHKISTKKMKNECNLYVFFPLMVCIQLKKMWLNVFKMKETKRTKKKLNLEKYYYACLSSSMCTIDKLPANILKISSEKTKINNNNNNNNNLDKMYSFSRSGFLFISLDCILYISKNI